MGTSPIRAAFRASFNAMLIKKCRIEVSLCSFEKETTFRLRKTDLDNRRKGLCKVQPTTPGFHVHEKQLTPTKRESEAVNLVIVVAL
jgi:hypothetical protein